MNGGKKGTSTQRLKIKHLLSNDNFKHGVEYKNSWTSMFYYAAKMLISLHSGKQGSDKDKNPGIR